MGMESKYPAASMPDCPLKSLESPAILVETIPHANGSQQRHVARLHVILKILGRR